MMSLIQTFARFDKGVTCLLVLVLGLLMAGCATTASLRPQATRGAPAEMYGLSIVYKYPKHVVFEQARKAAKALGFTIEETGTNRAYFIAQRTVKVGKITVVGHGEILGVYFEEQGPMATMVTINSKRKIATNIFAKDFSKTLHSKIGRTLQALGEQSELGTHTGDRYRLTVNATPADSTIKIMNIVPKYRPGIELQPGQYDIWVIHPGYKKLHQWVEIRDSDLTFDVTLEQKPKKSGSETPDTAPPHIVILSPDPTTGNPRVLSSTATIRGHVSDTSGVAKVTVNGRTAVVEANGDFTAQVQLGLGANYIAVTAMDVHRNVSQRGFTIDRAVAAGTEHRRALVIGNAAYPTAPLRNPVNDAADVAAALRRLDFEVTVLRDATHQEIENAVEHFSRQLRRGGVGLLYYAGHGMQLNGENYLIPVDARLQTATDVKFEAVPVAWVLERMRDASNELNMVILDACRDNPFMRGWRSSQRGLAVMQVARGTLISYATEPGGVALDGDERNGIYTKHLLRHIEEEKLSVEQLFKRVRRGVYKETAGKQIPWETSSLTGDFYFVPGAAIN